MTNINNSPNYLKQKGLFCLWKYETRDGKHTKVPYSPRNPGQRARSNDPRTFADLKQAAANMAGFDGLGIGVFGIIAGIDIDHCIEGGQLSAMAQDIIATMDSYTEVSPSGTGVRIFFLAPGLEYDQETYYIKNSRLGLEVYVAGITNRYLTITGNTLRAGDLENRGQHLQAILAKYMQRPQTPATATADSAAPLAITDADLIARASAAKNGAQFLALWRGDITGYPSHSEADLALCSFLAFYTGDDYDRIDGLFRRSGLFREKWAQRGTYRTATIKKAIASCNGNFYTGRPTPTPAAEDFALDWDDEIGTDAAQSMPAAAEIPAPVAAPAAAQAADLEPYYEQAMQDLGESAEAQEYLQHNLGISLETAATPIEAAAGCFAGYSSAWINPKAIASLAAKGNPWRPDPKPCLIFPVTKTTYISWDMRTDLDDQQKRFRQTRVGPPAILGLEALYSGAQTVFVVEQIPDWYAAREAGQTAIALIEPGNAGRLLSILGNRPTDSVLILSLPNSTEGRKAAQQLRDGLARLNVSYVMADISSPAESPWEALARDRAAFERAIEKAIAGAAAKPDSTGTYLDDLMAGEIERFKKARDRMTGFSNLDEKAGGLNSGLYVLAAISSLGKTTLALQMADQMAAAGHDVLFFSMEQSRLEMVSKSLARITAQKDLRTAVTSLSIRKGYLPPQVLAAAKEYRDQIGGRMNVIEGNFNCDIGYISEYIRRYRQRTGTAPIVFLDYLQFLQPAAEGKTRNSKKEEIDLAVRELKQMSREQDLTIIVISSINRANYMTPFAFESLKESGDIEFTADCVWGLQLTCLDEDLFDQPNKIKEKRARIDAAKEENPRKVKFVCLKNRYGISRYDCYFTYYPANDLFIPDRTRDSGSAAKDFKNARRV